MGAEAPGTGDATAPSPEGRDSKGRDIGLWAMVLLAVPYGIGAAYVGARLAMIPLSEAIASHPQIVVMDVAAALRGVPPEQAAEVIARQWSVAQRLGERGLVVLDRQAVLAGPESVYLRSGRAEER